MNSRIFVGVVRLAAGVATGVAAVTALFALLIAISGDLDHPFFPPFLAVAAAFALFGCVLVGVPTFLVLTVCGIRSSRIYAAIGFFIPLVLTPVLQPFGNDGYPGFILQGLFFGVFGVVAALSIWVTAVRPLDIEIGDR